MSFQGSPAMLALPEAMADAMFVAGSDAVRAAEQWHCMRPAYRLLVPACRAWNVPVCHGRVARMHLPFAPHASWIQFPVLKRCSDAAA